ncbi:unnamed protein product [Bursaphelenchus xylophilus]|uniref:(pine wood nematode) hypothetical protein n=1 Tax=Bursaphelenchus xylophilus TaxID=6326 RepID=A0A1I7SC90_BURXY|nr:unnamed protein product [Bursaphelenchus xylophilus]CAG9094541.1 unnamed protein product [Bursaphelenchus xylophilus]
METLLYCLFIPIIPTILPFALFACIRRKVLPPVSRHKTPRSGLAKSAESYEDRIIPETVVPASQNNVETNETDVEFNLESSLFAGNASSAKKSQKTKKKKDNDEVSL